MPQEWGRFSSCAQKGHINACHPDVRFWPKIPEYLTSTDIDRKETICERCPNYSEKKKDAEEIKNDWWLDKRPW